MSNSDQSIEQQQAEHEKDELLAAVLILSRKFAAFCERWEKRDRPVENGERK